MPSTGDGADGVDEAPPVREAYDAIAEHFAATREYAWPEVEAFLDDAPQGGLGLDIGCGNGRHTEALAAVVDRTVGIDVSCGLLATATERASTRGWSASFVQGDVGTLPLRADTVAVGLYVATLHHVRGREARVASLDELARVLAPDGVALVSAWSTAHDRFDAGADDDSGFDTTVDWTLPGGETVPRFYHIYAPAEFDAALAASDLRLLERTVSSGNCYARVTPEQ